MELLEAIERELRKELESDYSWKFVPEDSRDEIVRIHLEKIAEWLVKQTHNYRVGG